MVSDSDRVISYGDGMISGGERVISGGAITGRLLIPQMQPIMCTVPTLLQEGNHSSIGCGGP